MPDTGLLTCVFIYLFKSRGTAYMALIAFLLAGSSSVLALVSIGCFNIELIIIIIIKKSGQS